MKCPHLIKLINFMCKAQEKMYCPSKFQLKEYCKKASYKKCPFYNLRINKTEIDRMVLTTQC